METSPDWIAIDWGTTNLRAWAMSIESGIIDSIKSDDGMASLSPPDFEPTLIKLIEPWLSENRTTSVIGCGMVGAKQGWHEAPYAAAPCPPATTSTIIPTTDHRISVEIRAGIKQDSPADVMRGEETQVAGFLANQPDFVGVICLPGTHSKWVEIRGGLIQRFQTFMTGEIFKLLAENSVLRHSVDSTSLEEPAFLSAFNHALKNPAQFSANLFSLRAESLLANLPPSAASARLSGLLMGIEFAGARHFWENQSETVIIGAEELSKNYELALRSLNIPARHFSAAKMTLAGLKNEPSIL